MCVFGSAATKSVMTCCRKKIYSRIFKDACLNAQHIYRSNSGALLWREITTMRARTLNVNSINVLSSTGSPFH